MQFLRKLGLAVIMVAFVAGCYKQPAPSAAGGEAPPGAKKAQQQAPRTQKGPQQAAKPAGQKQAAKPKPKQAAKPKPAPLKTVKAWEFDKLAKDQWEWTLQKGEFKPWANTGIFFDRRVSGPGPVLEKANLDAKSVKAIRVTLRVFKRAGDKDLKEITPDHLTLYWARQGVEEKLFEKRQGQPMKPMGEADKTTVFVAPVDGNKEWNGTIDGLYVSVALPKDKLADGEFYRVVLRKIEFVG